MALIFHGQRTIENPLPMEVIKGDRLNLPKFNGYYFQKVALTKLFGMLGVTDYGVCRS